MSVSIIYGTGTRLNTFFQFNEDLQASAGTLVAITSHVATSQNCIEDGANWDSSALGLQEGMKFRKLDSEAESGPIDGYRQVVE